MKKYAAAVFVLTALALAFMAGLFLVRREDGAHWTVAVQREDAPTGAVSKGDEWPAGLLEGERINVNTASAGDLRRLPGIGAERAEAIVTERQEGGAFENTEDLLRVDGIGTGLLEQLRPYVTVEEK